MLPEWTFGLLLGFHIDQRCGSCVGSHCSRKVHSGNVPCLSSNP
jgi:hypothetical protein